MAPTETVNSRATKRLPTTANSTPRSLDIIEGGVDNAVDFYRFAMALARDVLNGTITPAVCNGAAHAAGRALKVLDLQFRMGNKPLLSITDNGRE